MMGADTFRRLVLVLFFVVNTQQQEGPVLPPTTKSNDSIRITSFLRGYIAGPIEGKSELTKYDSIILYAGEFSADKNNIRSWAMLGDTNNFCLLHRIYHYGREALFLCPISGSYIAYFEDTQTELTGGSALPTIYGTADQFQEVWETRDKVKPFDLATNLPKNKTILANQLANLIQSDPFEIIDSDYCYYWSYRVREKSKVGYIFRQSEPLTGVTSGPAYVIMELIMWIIEPSAVSESERAGRLSYSNDYIVSNYSKLLTRRFNAKGLLPCLRKVHPSVELASDIEFVEEFESNFGSPHWTAELKIHTNTLVASLSDITFTISSRQHIALFHCFVGDIRVFIRAHDFDFLEKGQSDQISVNWDVSAVDETFVDYLRLKVKHIYGHTGVYVGQPLSRSYQPGPQRTDMVVLPNPCVAQEFAVAAGGRIYLVEEFLRDYKRNMLDIVLPGLGDIDADASESEQRMKWKHGAYLPIADAAFTPTHVVFLMDDSSMFFHSHSIYYKGFAYLTSTKKDRLVAIVKRRWCAQTGIPKTSNLVIPAYSSTGNIIITQIFPVEGSVNMRLHEFPDSCISKDAAAFENTEEEIRKGINETCIHRDEVVQHSDERGLPESFDIQECYKDEYLSLNVTYSDQDPDQTTSFLMNQGKIYSEIDPHFPNELTNNVGIYKSSDNSTFFNKVLTFHVDHSEQGGKKLRQVLEKNGFHLFGETILHSVEFTAVENKFIVGVEFKAEEFDKTGGDKYDFTMLITTVATTNMPSRIFPLSTAIEEKLDTFILFPGVVLARKTPYMLKNVSSPTDPPVPYITKLYPINTAVPEYIIDFGNVFVFSSVESKYARPLTFYSRTYIHDLLRQLQLGNTSQEVLKDEQRRPVFSDPSYTCATRSCPLPSEKLLDIVVTEQGIVSILKRRPLVKSDEGQSAFIGSIVTLDSLREVRPFSALDNVFQRATPDGEVVYGKFDLAEIMNYPLCKNAAPESNCLRTDNSQLCNVARDSVNATVDGHEIGCLKWEFVDEIKSGNPPTDNKIGYCGPSETDNHCIDKKDKGEPENSPSKKVGQASILEIPFESLLNGNLLLVPEEKIGVVQSSVGLSEDKLCPFAHFQVDFVKFDYAEVGFRTRITATVSYLGRNVPAEANLLIEYDNISGVHVVITSSLLEEKDQTTLSKTIDITTELSDINLLKMKNTRFEHRFLEQRNLGKEPTDLFSVTIRPSIINVRCKKEDFFTTIHFSIGCNPFNRMRLIAEAAPLIRKPIKPYLEKDKESSEWRRKGDVLIVPRDQVWHRQREKFKCPNNSNNKDIECEIPYAYLYEDNVYDLSWRDPFVPQFEQLLRTHSRRVSGNVILYDLLGFNTVTNISTLQAGCHISRKTWYQKLLKSTSSIGIDTSEQEDIYHYFEDCYTTDSKRDKPFELKTQDYRLINLTNHNRVRFDIVSDKIRTKNRNQIFIFRATVVNTDFNKFTYCKLMDTFFLVRIVGIPTPRQVIEFSHFAAIVIILLLFFVIIYFVFYRTYTWKLDIPAIAEQNPALDQNNMYRPVTGKVESDHLMRRVAVKMHAVAKWRHKALLRAMKRYENTDKKPEWLKQRIDSTGPSTRPSNSSNTNPKGNFVQPKK